jgi:acyl-CoA reductase-like NAD-dependent aldehyde dehydrogenase
MAKTFIHELIRAANLVEKLTMPERARLLQRAADAICDHEINLSKAPVSVQWIVFDLGAIANAVERFPDSAVSGALLDAIGVIRAAKILLGEKQEIEHRQ